MDNFTPGDVGGVAAGIGVAALWILKFVRNLTGWVDRRRREEEKRLDAYRASLVKWDKEQRQEIEARVDALEAELEGQGLKLHEALALQHLHKVALSEVTLELERTAPNSLAIKHARVLLHPMFRVDMLSPAPTPAELLDVATELDRRIASR